MDSQTETPDYSTLVSATGFLRLRSSRSLSTVQSQICTSHRVLALLGAGLSAPSGLPTYRGAGGLWRNHDAAQLSTPAAFAEDPALVWQFYVERWKEVRGAEPNAAHSALAEYATVKKGAFLALTMNVDDLSERAGHPEERLKRLHGGIFDVKCTNCDIILTGSAASSAIAPLLECSESNPFAADDIPLCSKERCGGILRPGVVWFSEKLPKEVLQDVADWIEEDSIDTMLVIGTSALVYPATAYIEAARRKGARVAVVDMEKEDPSLLGLGEQDWYFQGDAVALIPEMLGPVITGGR